MNLYTETPEAGQIHRESFLAEVQALIARQQEQAKTNRLAFFQPDFSSPEIYADSVDLYREAFKEMLGWPLNQDALPGIPTTRTQFVAEDDLGRIERIWIETLPGLHTYGLLFLPASPGPHPLILSLHGGGGSPELCSSFFGSENYNDMTRRAQQLDAVVFAPQFLLWREAFGPLLNRQELDARLKQLGGSVTALEVYEVRRSLDYLTNRADVTAGRVGMIGLSYGGFYSLFCAAAEPRIKVSVSSCFFNDRTKYARADWSWFNAANTFLDAETAALICPRPFYIEVGNQDELFTVETAASEAARVREIYERLGIGERFRFKAFDGGHEIDRSEEAFEFLRKWL
jgi:dienelactone hydrolase